MAWQAVSLKPSRPRDYRNGSVLRYQNRPYPRWMRPSSTPDSLRPGGAVHTGAREAVMQNPTTSKQRGGRRCQSAGSPGLVAHARIGLSGSHFRKEGSTFIPTSRHRGPIARPLSGAGWAVSTPPGAKPLSATQLAGHMVRPCFLSLL